MERLGRGEAEEGGRKEGRGRRRVVKEDGGETGEEERGKRERGGGERKMKGGEGRGRGKRKRKEGSRICAARIKVTLI